MANKSYRWERMVEDCNFNDRSDACDAVKLLRAQHRAVVRMMQKDIDTYKAILATTDVVANAHLNALAGWVAVQKILDRLNKVAKTTNMSRISRF